MLACRLCLAWGVQDPEQWLEDCPPRVLNIWKAFSIADKWATQRRLQATNTVILKRLLAMKYKQDYQIEALKKVDETSERYLPADWQCDFEQEPTQMSEGILQVMNRGGTVLKTPLYTTEIEFDPWQRQ